MKTTIYFIKKVVMFGSYCLEGTPRLWTLFPCISGLLISEIIIPHLSTSYKCFLKGVLGLCVRWDKLWSLFYIRG